MQSLVERLWPRAYTDLPEVREVKDISPEEVNQVNKTQDTLRRELIRAETEHIRLRGMYDRGDVQQ